MTKNTTWLWLLVIVLVALVAYSMMRSTGFGGAKGKTDYQAVFLSNGQVYFGKVSSETGPVVIVKDIFYLRVQQQVQPKAEGETQQPQVSLVKLGNEIHGPTDEMRINRDHVLFVEDLKTDGKVVTAIKDFQANGSKDTSSPSTPTDKQP